MKKIFALCALIVAIGAALAWRAAAKPSRYGSFTGASSVDLAAAIAAPRDFLGRTIEIEGTISEQCKSMGCFFFFRSGKDTLRVDLQEIAMHAPMREGRRARVEGQLVPYNGTYQFYASAVEFK